MSTEFALKTLHFKSTTNLHSVPTMTPTLRGSSIRRTRSSEVVHYDENCRIFWYWILYQGTERSTAKKLQATTRLLLALEPSLRNSTLASPCRPWYWYVQAPPTQLTYTWF